MAFTRCLAVVALTCAITVKIANVAWAQDPLGGLALGAGLKAFGDQLKEVLEKAIGGGLMLEIQAGGQIGVLIQQADAAYQNDLSLTYDKLNSAEKQTVDNIASLMNDYSKQIYSQAKDITERAQQAANTIPFSKTFPQLTSFDPVYTIQTNTAPIHITLNGNFVDVARQNYDATIQVNDKTYKNVVKTTQNLGFDLPLSSLTKDPTHVSSNYLTVDVPYEETTFWWFTSKKDAQFSIPLAVLPVKVGTLTFKTDLTVPGVETQSFTTGEIDQDSADDDIKCGGEHLRPSRGGRKLVRAWKSTSQFIRRDPPGCCR